MSAPDQRVRIDLERRGFDWTGTAIDPAGDDGHGRLVHRHGPVGSPGEVLDELALPLDAAEAERVVDAKATEAQR